MTQRITPAFFGMGSTTNKHPNEIVFLRDKDDVEQIESLTRANARLSLDLSQSKAAYGRLSDDLGVVAQQRDVALLAESDLRAENDTLKKQAEETFVHMVKLIEALRNEVLNRRND